MILLPLLACVLLGALSAQAEVADSFYNCKDSFYKGTEPAGMDQNAKKICQKLDYSYYYATLYSTYHRLPIYSAYTFKSDEQQSGSSRRSTWFIEPQLSLSYFRNPRYDKMMLESDVFTNLIKGSQAINNDYSKTGYDRGHLNPNCYQCDEGRDATFTLTNAAPMDPCFNRMYWFQWEKGVRDFLKKNAKKAPAYIVTGTVLPHPNVRIPEREESSQGQSSDEYERVTVPSHIWTAVCYKDPIDSEKSFSFGYIGRNEAETSIRLMPVTDLNSKLSQLCQRAGNVQGGCTTVSIFVDECFGSSTKYGEIVEQLKKSIKLTQLQKRNNFIQMTGNRRADSRKRPYSVVQYGSITDFSEDLESMKQYTDTACVLTQFPKLVDISRISDLRKRDVKQGSDAVKCQEVTEKSDPTAATAADGTRCQNWMRFCQTKEGFKPCCSTPCLYKETQKDYFCRSGQTEIQCSPQYSSITIKGENCREDHQCGKYGEDYYWCKKSRSWDFCSPPLWKSKAINGRYCRNNHACAYYDEKYTWCYTDNDNNWNHCCNHDDCFSATYGKTCKPDHPCGYHGEDYLWCYTTDGNGNWKKCCTEC